MASTQADAAEAVKTPAQLLQEKADAEAHADHHAFVEEVVDEEDIEHPPPSQHLEADESATATQGNGTMSAKAAGKQKASDKPATLDTQDEEAFPALGAGTKSSGPASKTPGWGPNPSVRKAPNGAQPTSRPASSGVPTPSSTGRNTPNAASMAGRGGPGSNVSLPGRGTDALEIDTQDLDRSKNLRGILDAVKRKYGVTVTTSEVATGSRSKTRFLAEGPKGRVTEALMNVSKELTKETTAQVEIPSAVSPQVIGKAGANIKNLEAKFSVKINIKRNKDAASAGEEDFRTDVVQISGHAAQVRQVQQNILEKVRQFQPKIDLPVRGIPPEFYPFIASRHAAELERMQQENDLRVKVPSFYRRQQQAPPRQPSGPMFVPHGDSHIVVSGEQAAAAQARAQLESLAEQLQAELALEELLSDQILHPYVVGDRGMDPLEFMAQTGCAILLPPEDQDADEIQIIGPRERIEEGRALAEQLMSQKHNREVDMRKHFADAPHGHDKHSRALAQYLQQKAIEREFTQHNAEIVYPSQRNPNFTVITDDPQKAMSARNDLAKITQAFPASRFGLLDVDPFYYQHLQQRHAENLRSEQGVLMIVPDNDEDPVILVYEGPSEEEATALPRNKPTASEIADFEAALQAAQALILGDIPEDPISQQHVPVPRKYHEKVRRFMGNEPQPEQGYPIEVSYGPRSLRQPPVLPPEVSPSDHVFLRGPSPEDIAELQRKIEEFLIEAEQEEKERGYTTTLDIPAQYNKNLVGKQGQHIKSLKDKHDVDIQTSDTGKVTIQGPQKKAEACKAEIAKLAKQWADEVNYSITVDPKYHGELIGPQGQNLRKMQARADNTVRIDFPRVNKAGDDDAASEAGATKQQSGNEIRIRGPRAKADQVRDELLSLAQYLQDTSHTATVSVSQDQIASLIGKKGAEMEKLRAETGAQIEVPNKGGADETGRVTIQIKGMKAQVDKAKSDLQQRSKAFDAVTQRTISVDRKHHGALIGTQGSNIQRIVAEAGAPGQSAEHVRFPHAGEKSNDLTVKGTDDVVEKIIAAIQAFADERDNQITETIEVPTSQHRDLIGPGGSHRKSLEDKFKVQMNIPRQGSGQTGVRITGKSDAVAQAREHIQGMAKKPEGKTVMVPKHLHHTVSKNGNLFRDLSRQGVKVDHNGHRPPPRGSGQPSPAVRSKMANGAMPLITDQPDADAHVWDMVTEDPTSNSESGEIPWVLTGSKDNSDEAIEKAIAQIESLLASANQPKTTGYLILPDPRLHRHIIGRGGSTINNIRKQSGCDIQVPNRNAGGADDEAITIVGDEEGVIAARDMILEEIKNAQNER